MTVLSDRGAAWLRTVMPGLWSVIVTLLLQLWTSAPSEIADLLGSDVAVSAVTVGVLAVWYPLAHWLEDHVPRAVVIALFGTAQTPVYHDSVQ